MTNTISAVARRRGSLATNRTTTRLGGPAVAANMAINMPKFLKENFGRHASPTNICGRKTRKKNSLDQRKLILINRFNNKRLASIAEANRKNLLTLSFTEGDHDVFPDDPAPAAFRRHPDRPEMATACLRLFTLRPFRLCHLSPCGYSARARV